jgi:hypothetical protein
LQVHVCKYAKLQIYNLTNCKCTFSSSQVCKLQNYKIINCMCLFVNFKFTKLKTSQVTILKLQVHFCIFTSLHMLDFLVFILACTTKLPNYQLQI